MGNSAERDIRKANQAEKQLRALEIRKTGATYDEIAAQMGLASRSVAFGLVKRAIRKIPAEAATEVLSLELARLDALLVGCWTKATTGDPAAVDRVLRIMDRRAAFLGLDQPKGLKVEVDRELEGFLERLREGLEPDVFERVLAVAVGVDGATGTRSPEGGEGPGEDEDDDKPDGA